MTPGIDGTAAARRETLIVADVDQFPGHITCDAASRSEIVVPLFRGDELLGVLDVDSPRLNRFGDAEKAVLEELVKTLLEQLFDGDAALPRTRPAFAAR